MSDNQEPITTPEKTKSKKLIISVTVAAVVIIAAVILIVVLTGKSKTDTGVNNATTVNSTANTNTNEGLSNTNTTANQNANTASTAGKVLGQSTGKLPYATIDEEHTVTEVMDSNGGVVKTTLAKNVIAYLVIPKDEVIQGATISLIPYTAMPSSQKHGYLSDELGFGVQVQIKSLQMGIRGYLVFDTTGGTATAEAVAKAKYFNRCDPNLKWFDPYLCAKKNKVPASTVVTKDATIITPIYVEKVNSLIFPRNTIPMGIDGLIALRIKGGDVFIPQKLDQPLVNKLTKDTISQYSSNAQKLEAVGLAMAWDVNEYAQEQIKLISRLAEGDYYQETIKALAVSQQFSVLLKAGGLTITRGEFDDMTNDELLAAIDENLADLAKTFLEDAQDVTKKFGFGIDSIEAAAAISDAAQLGLAGASQTLGTVRSNIESTGTSSSSSLDRRSSALESSDYTNPSGSEPQLTPEILQGIARDVVNHVWADPKATIEEILNAMYLARITGLDNADEICSEGLEKIIKILEQMLKDAKYKDDYLDITEIACSLGIEEICQEAFNKAKDAPSSPELCDLVKKNLSNYGINECDAE